MEIRILHIHEPPYGWWFTSPDLRMSGSDDTFAACRDRAESAARFSVACEAEEEGRPPPDLDAIEFVHFVRVVDVADADP